MSKELESYKKLVVNLMTGRYIEENRELLTIIEKALTPPTVDEVCKALSEYWKEEVKYIPNKVKRYGFYLVESGVYIICRDYDNEIVLYHNDYIKANKYPSYLMTMIGRFYEG